VAAVAGLSMLASTARAQTALRPHILYIMADDLGYHDVGFHGSDIQTPNLDRLAAGGAKLEQFYAQPMCTPTRAAFLTGRYPLRYGLQTGVIPSGATYGLATEEWLLPQALGEVGYHSALIGKWHLGHGDRKYWPGQRGFDYFYGPLVGEIDHYTHEAHGVLDWYRNDQTVAEKGYDTDLLGAEAVRLIDKHEPQTPLFLYLAFTAPHAPFQAPATYLERYATIADPNRRAYAAMITAMDDQIGKVVNALERRGMRDNTIIVFHSDNGGTRSSVFTGEKPVAGAMPAQNTPFRDGKGTLYEGGTRVVAIANWPGKIAPSEADGVMHVVDMMPTLARLAGADLSKTKSLDGIDVWPALSAAKSSPRSEVVYNVEPSQGALRRGPWKLHWLATLPPKVELFNLDSDPSETTDLAAQHPDKVAELQAEVVKLAQSMAPPLFFMAALQLTLSYPPSTPRDALYELGMTDHGSPS
jgi:arylsulfatase A-like enzyme